MGYPYKAGVTGLLLCQFAPFWKKKGRCLGLMTSRASPQRLTTPSSSWGWWIARTQSCWRLPARQSTSQKKGDAIRGGRAKKGGEFCAQLIKYRRQHAKYSCVVSKGSVVANTAERYRRLAQECRRIADAQPPGSSSRGYLFEMARLWERLTHEVAASRIPPSFPAIKPERPTMQQ